ncbi:hydroxymethylbilane synthase [Christensenella tenuis]|jgi:hydroxymethylbilane synthase|uniref:Porphobilinogen deaminase n=1 Tax=Christensenella tenuis TaxID=2763033 RepID=A0ABR7EHD0_9FIRM|nr:hydroxymethylbilane synthase [Christensenella tenuis]MBC5649182.1 hydroxymethylbilane synthase [Christensenella tenuis]
MIIRVGSRASKLAVIQSQIVIDKIKKLFPDIRTELVTMKTAGDRILDKTLDQIGGKGLFVKELDRALTEERVDITVHSLKDVPMVVPEEIPICAVLEREDPRDALVLPEGKERMERDRPIGCSSLRRTSQLENLYEGWKVKPVRGNVLTRLEKLDRGEYSALILAKAGLSRLGIAGRIARIFGPDEMIPAACQGIIAVQARAGYAREVMQALNDKDSMIMAQAERAFVRALDGGCSVPTAAYCEVLESEIRLTGYYITPSGNKLVKTMTGPVQESRAIGINLAMQMKEES